MAIKANHIEVPVTDLEKAKEFYGSVFSWEKIMQQWNENYILVSSGDNDVSFGIYKVDKVPENLVTITMGVQDIDESMKTILSNGGSLVREKYEIDPKIGYAANFKDPFGNIWGLHSPPVSE